MQLNIQKWGNSAAVRLPSAVLAQLGAQVGDAFDLNIADGTASLRLARPRYKLADLLAQCDPKAQAAKLDDWDNARPVGQEVW